jgi:hypothetical protein
MVARTCCDSCRGHYKGFCVLTREGMKHVVKRNNSSHKKKEDTKYGGLYAASKGTRIRENYNLIKFNETKRLYDQQSKRNACFLSRNCINNRGRQCGFAFLKTIYAFVHLLIYATHIGQSQRFKFLMSVHIQKEKRMFVSLKI